MTTLAERTRTSEGVTAPLPRLPFALDAGVAQRARLGLIVLATDHTIEHEWRRILADVPGVGLYESRILNDARITPETLAAMEDRLAGAPPGIMPGVPPCGGAVGRPPAPGGVGGGGGAAR